MKLDKQTIKFISNNISSEKEKQYIENILMNMNLVIKPNDQSHSLLIDLGFILNKD